MPKRRHDETEEDRWRRKMRKYEKKLAEKQPQIAYSGENEVLQEPLYTQEYFEPEIEDSNEPAPVAPEALGVDSPEALTAAPAEPPGATSTEAPPPPPVEPTIDPELLQALGDCHTDAPEWGEDILNDISQRWEPILKGGLKKEVKEDLHKKYLLPKNVQSSKAPTLNPEVSAMLTEACRNRDTRLCTKQNQLGNAIAALGKAMTGILTKKIDTPEVLRILNDAGKLMADSHYLETDTRRSLITPLLDKSYVAPFKDRKRDNFLFGENLGEFIKSSRGIKKTGQLITPPAPSTSTTSTSLNWKGPPRQTSSYRGGANRGGQRGPQVATARRAPPPHAPRRAPPPPPPASSNKRQSAQLTSRSRNTK